MKTHTLTRSGLFVLVSIIFLIALLTCTTSYFGMYYFADQHSTKGYAQHGPLIFSVPPTENPRVTLDPNLDQDLFCESLDGIGNYRLPDGFCFATDNLLPTTNAMQKLILGRIEKVVISGMAKHDPTFIMFYKNHQDFLLNYHVYPLVKWAIRTDVTEGNIMWAEIWLSSRSRLNSNTTMPVAMMIVHVRSGADISLVEP